MSWPDSAQRLASLAPWFDGARRDLPWRALDLDAPHPDPYAVLVSELMLQQTQVATVIPFFRRWMACFPDAAALARASEDEIHKQWEGLGYYRRARFLQAAARRIAQEGWPSDLGGLMGLPGLGPYTSAAVAAIAFQLPTPALDGNAFRVLTRVLGIEDDPLKSAARLRTWLEPALRAHGPSRLTQAIMELGATVCTPAPRCLECPLASGCEALRLDATQRIPARQPRTAPVEVDLWLLAVQSEGRWLLRQPTAQGLLAGLWRWPSLAVEPPPEGAGEEPLPFGLTETRAWPPWTQVYTHRRENVRPLALEFGAPFPAPAGTLWLEESQLDVIPMGRRDQRLLGLLRTPPAIDEEAPPLAGLLRRLQS